jgi:hypothetical protein
LWRRDCKSSREAADKEKVLFIRLLLQKYEEIPDFLLALSPEMAAKNRL